MKFISGFHKLFDVVGNKRAWAIDFKPRTKAKLHLYTSNYIIGLVYKLSHDCHFDIDRDVSTAHCRSPSGDCVNLLSRTICNTVVVSDWCFTNLAHGWWVSIQSIVGHCHRRKLIPQRSVVVGNGCYVV